MGKMSDKEKAKPQALKSGKGRNLCAWGLQACFQGLPHSSKQVPCLGVCVPTTEPFSGFGEVNLPACQLPRKREKACWPCVLTPTELTVGCLREQAQNTRSLVSIFLPYYKYKKYSHQTFEKNQKHRKVKYFNSFYYKLVIFPKIYRFQEWAKQSTYK